MARTTAIASVGEAVVRLLNDTWTAAGGAGAAAQVFAVADFDRTIDGHGVGLFLYRVAVNGPQRNRSARVDATGRRLRPSLPVDLHYLLAPWGRQAEVQHERLGWAMRTLEDHAVLPPGRLNAVRPNSFLPSEAVELVCDPLGVQDQTALWQALRVPWRLAVGYAARMVALDSDVEYRDGPPVRERAFDLRGRAEE